MNRIKWLLIVFLAVGLLSSALAASITSARPAERALLAVYAGTYDVDGDLSEWTARQRIDLTPVYGFEVYGTYDAISETYIIAIQTDGTVIGNGTTIYLDTDQDLGTGGTAGADYFIQIVGGFPELYTGAGAFVTLISDYAFSGAMDSWEIALPASQIGNVSGDIDLAVSVNNAINIPVLFGTYDNLTLLVNDLPERTSTERRIAIVYSDATAKRLYGGVGERDYTQLYASVQHQAMMAGVPYDLIHDSELMTLTNIINYDALVMPSFRNVLTNNVSFLPQVEENLLRASYNYGIGMISSADFMVADQNDNPLPLSTKRQNFLFGLQVALDRTASPPYPALYGSNKAISLTATSVPHPVMQGYSGDTIITYTSSFYAPLEGFDYTSSIVQPIVTLAYINHLTETVTLNGVVATETGGRNVLFGNLQFMGDRNLLWQAIQWVVYGDELAPVGLKLGRQNNLFVSRNDMDQTQFIEEQQGLGAEGVTNKLYHDFLMDWKQQYNFVGSYYLNIGYDFDDPNDPNCYTPLITPDPDRLTFGRASNQEGLACTRWHNDELSSTQPGIAYTYTLYLIDGNEIGSHSYTHLAPVTGTIANPIGLYTDTNGNGVVDIDDLTPLQRSFEFSGSINVIEANLGIDVTGAAGPGNPESLATALELDAAGYMEYFSGGYSSIGAGFPSVFGRLTPDFNMIYMAPNMTFDFAMISFFGLTPAEAEIRWQNEYMDLNQWANQPILHWPWHDYALGSIYESQNYTTTMFTSLLGMAYGDNAEFITADDLQRRIRSYEASELYLSEAGGSVTAQVLGTGLGRSSLEVNPGTGNVLASVDGWYAYSDDHIFLPSNGGTFTANFAPTPANVTRITSLPMRADLQSVTGNGGDIRYTFQGEGSVFLDVNIPADLTSANAVISSTAVYTWTGNILEMNFGTIDTHTAELYFVVPNLLLDKQANTVEAIPGRPVTYTITLTNNGRATATGVQLSDTMPAEFNGFTAVDESNNPLTNVGTTPNYVWPISDIPANTSRTIRVVGTLNNQTTSNSTLTNTASVAITAPEGNLLDNIDSTAVQVSNTQRCGLVDGMDYAFNADAPVTMHITDTGSLDCVTVEPVLGNHPATNLDDVGLQANGRWWRLTAVDSSGADASGTFSLTLTLPTDFPPTDQDKLCRYLNPVPPQDQVWDCGYSSHTTNPNPNSITRHGVTEFSDWIAARNVGPTAVTVFGVQVGGNTAVVWLLPFLFLFLTLLVMTAWVWQKRPARQ